MRLKNEDSRSLFGVLMIIALISALLAALLAAGVWGHMHNTRRNNAKEYFGISNAFDLSVNEKIMLRPMVDRQLKTLKDKATDAAGEEFQLGIGTRNDISPATADNAVAELRAAQAKKKEAARNLATACKTARYFSLISKESEWCK